MCGIAGFWDLRGALAGPAMAERLCTMTDALVHRGPDGEGFWIDEAAGVALGHRRLSIVDLSPAGAQPMISSCGRFVLTYNGEVYNMDELRPQLVATGCRFRGHSDTEVILESISRWGVRSTISQLIGMFAFAVWDRHEHTITLVRDRLGIKPLYWMSLDRRFLFGSELKAFRAALPDWQPELNLDVLLNYVRFGYVPNPRCIYSGAAQLSPGTMLTLFASGETRIEKFWDLQEVASNGQGERWKGTEQDASEALEKLLSDAVRRRMIADVPVGAFLSGGIDSSTVVALMQANSTRPIRTFTIGFRESAYNEAAHAAEVARHLKTQHTDIVVDPAKAREVIPRLPDMFDEPFGDSSQIPTFLVSEMTRQHVTVALSGDGGDEIFAGYNRYLKAHAVYRARDHIPEYLRKLAGTAIDTLSTDIWSRIGGIVPRRHRPSELGEKMHKLGAVLAETGDEWFVRAVSLWPQPSLIVPKGTEPRGLLWDRRQEQIIVDRVERLQYLDTLTYLPDDILTKVDRASMAVGLEARVPLLDHRVVAFSWSVPPGMKLGGGVGKRLLRRILYRHVPRTFFDRPKTGFTMPISDWLRGPLRDWAEALLDERSLRDGGIFEVNPVRLKWREHLDGRRNWQHQLWVILMFQAWRERWLSGHSRFKIMASRCAAGYEARK